MASSPAAKGAAGREDQGPSDVTAEPKFHLVYVSVVPIIYCITVFGFLKSFNGFSAIIKLNSLFVKEFSEMLTSEMAGKIKLFTTPNKLRQRAATSRIKIFSVSHNN